ncbi:fimbrial protein [Aeromonas sobria]|uniref:fimbrial protein n=1 Tax=Aeromonas sobria TaxID=646 RepID=UPI003F391F7C
MKKNIIALTVLMALSVTAQAATTTVETNHTLSINGLVNVDSCAFEDLTVDGQLLTLTLDEVSVASLSDAPSDIMKSLDAKPENTLICPAGLTDVKLSISGVANTDGEVLNNTAATLPAEFVAFKVKAAFGEELTQSTPWIDFSLSPEFSATPDAEGKIAVNFGANYVLTGPMRQATAGNVAADLPFKIIYN